MIPERLLDYTFENVAGIPTIPTLDCTLVTGSEQETRRKTTKYGRRKREEDVSTLSAEDGVI